MDKYLETTAKRDSFLQANRKNSQRLRQQNGRRIEDILSLKMHFDRVVIHIAYF